LRHPPFGVEFQPNGGNPEDPVNAAYDDHFLTAENESGGTVFDIIQNLIDQKLFSPEHSATYSSEADLWTLVEFGFPTNAYEILANQLQLPKNAIGAETTIRNRLRHEKTLSTEESERVIRLLRIFATARNLYGSTDKAIEWMHKPRRFLPEKDPVTPIELAATDVGARLVEEKLLRTTYGVF
jgi:putative toxin-antitoxin system antitoxin component (TIGR02293 family)